MERSSNEMIFAFLFGSLMLALIGVFVFIMVILYQKRKIRSIREQQLLINQYERSVLKAKVEIREETLKYVGQELHDNVGQLLSLIKLHLSRPGADLRSDVRQLIDQAITAIRALSHDLNINRVEQYSLSEFIDQELCKVDKSGLVKTLFEHDGGCEPTNIQNRLMVSRIFQECVSNILKHAEAKHIFVKLESLSDGCMLSVADDGVGFDPATSSRGSGLANIYDRVKLIGGKVEIASTTGKGTTIQLYVPKR